MRNTNYFNLYCSQKKIVTIFTNLGSIRYLNVLKNSLMLTKAEFILWKVLQFKIVVFVAAMTQHKSFRTQWVLELRTAILEWIVHSNGRFEQIPPIHCKDPSQKNDSYTNQTYLIFISLSDTLSNIIVPLRSSIK